MPWETLCAVDILFVTPHPVDDRLIEIAATQGHRIHPVAGLADALAAVANAAPDAVLLDVPDEAAAFAASLQELAPRIPLVALVRERGAASEAMRQGAQDAILREHARALPKALMQALENARARGAFQAQQRLQRQEVAEGARRTALRQVLSELAHDVNQPLSAILNYARGALRGLDAAMPAERIRTALEAIGDQAERASETVGALREVVGGTPPAPRPADLNALVRDAMQLTASDPGAQGIVPQAELASGLPAVKAAPALIEQLLVNVLRNAVEAVAQGAAPRLLHVRTRSLTEHGCVEVAVSDSGPGVSRALRERIFEPFFTTKPDRVGLGLTISRAVVAFHQGTISIAESEWGGCAVIFTLPWANRDGGVSGAEPTPTARR